MNQASNDDRKWIDGLREWAALVVPTHLHAKTYFILSAEHIDDILGTPPDSLEASDWRLVRNGLGSLNTKYPREGSRREQQLAWLRYLIASAAYYSVPISAKTSARGDEKVDNETFETYMDSVVSLIHYRDIPRDDKNEIKDKTLFQDAIAGALLQMEMRERDQGDGSVSSRKQFSPFNNIHSVVIRLYKEGLTSLVDEQGALVGIGGTAINRCLESQGLWHPAGSAMTIDYRWAAALWTIAGCGMRKDKPGRDLKTAKNWMLHIRQHYNTLYGIFNVLGTSKDVDSQRLSKSLAEAMRNLRDLDPSLRNSPPFIMENTASSARGRG